MAVKGKVTEDMVNKDKVIEDTTTKAKATEDIANFELCAAVL